MPTTAQALRAVIICQSLSDLMQSIHLFRYNPITKNIYIIADPEEKIEIIIFDNGDWRFFENE